MKTKDKKICFIGDSITEGVGASSKEKCYVSVFEKISGADVTNLGISGTRIARQQKNMINEIWDSNEFLTRVDKIPKDTQIIAIFGGTNDYGHGDAPFGNMNDRTADTFFGALHMLSAAVIERFPAATVFFMTPLKRYDEYQKNASNSLTLESYADAVKSVAKYYSIPVLDLYAEAGMQPCIEAQNKYYFADGVHPNDTGHERVAKKVMEFIKNL